MLTIDQYVKFRDYHKREAEYLRMVMREEMADEDRKYYQLVHQMHVHRFLRLDLKICDLEFEQKKNETMFKPFEINEYISRRGKNYELIESIEQFLFAQL